MPEYGLPDPDEVPYGLPEVPPLKHENRRTVGRSKVYRCQCGEEEGPRPEMCLRCGRISRLKSWD